MKQKIFLTAVLMWTVVTASAQDGQRVIDGSQWNIGWAQFEAHVKPALIQMTSVNEGEPMAFVLVPEGPTKFIYAKAPEDLGEDPKIIPVDSKVVLKNQE